MMRRNLTIFVLTAGSGLRDSYGPAKLVPISFALVECASMNGVSNDQEHPSGPVMC